MHISERAPAALGIAVTGFLCNTEIRKMLTFPVLKPLASSARNLYLGSLLLLPMWTSQRFHNAETSLSPPHSALPGSLGRRRIPSSALGKREGRYCCQKRRWGEAWGASPVTPARCCSKSGGLTHACVCDQTSQGALWELFSFLYQRLFSFVIMFTFC